MFASTSVELIKNNSQTQLIYWCILLYSNFLSTVQFRQHNGMHLPKITTKPL